MRSSSCSDGGIAVFRSGEDDFEDAFKERRSSAGHVIVSKEHKDSESE